MGRPSRTLTNTPQPALQPPHVEANQLATPGVNSTGCFKYGMIFCSGALQPVNASAAAEKPIISMKVRLDTAARGIPADSILTRLGASSASCCRNIFQSLSVIRSFTTTLRAAVCGFADLGVFARNPQTNCQTLPETGFAQRRQQPQKRERVVLQ